MYVDRTRTPHRVFVTAQRFQKLPVGAVVHEYPVFDRDYELGSVGAEAQAVDGVTLGFILSLRHLPHISTGGLVPRSFVVRMVWSTYSFLRTAVVTTVRVVQPGTDWYDSAELL